MGIRWTLAACTVALIGTGCLRDGIDFLPDQPPGGDPFTGGDFFGPKPHDTPPPLPDSTSPPPASLAVASGPGALTVSWIDAPGALDYRIYYATETGITKLNYTTLAGGTALAGVTSPLQLHGVAPPDTFFLILTAVYTDGESTETAQIAGTPLAPDLVPDDTDDAAGVGNGQMELGNAMSGIDGNGDGFGDFVVGAWSFDNQQNNEGVGRGYQGSATGLSGTATWNEEGNATNRFFGCSIANAGDTNGDGFDDVIVGSYTYNDGQSEEGGAFGWRGGAGFLSGTLTWNVFSNQSNAHMGWAMAGVGDIDGDGFDDVVVGAPDYDNNQNNEGRAYLYRGSNGGLRTNSSWTFEPDQNNAFLGEALAGAGDVNGDGFDDVIVAAPNYDGGQSGEGRVYVFYGSAQGLPAAPSWMAESNVTDAQFGFSVSGGADINGDGYDDILVGAPGYDGGQQAEGRAYAFYGSAQGLSAAPDWMWESDQADAEAGTAVHLAPDINGDGYADAVVGVPLFDDGEQDEGVVELFYGGPGGLTPASVGRSQTNIANQEYGRALATSDVDGDGASDLFIGAPARSGNDGGWLMFFAPPSHGPRVWAGDPITDTNPTNIEMAGGSLDDLPSASTQTCDVDWGDGNNDQQTPCDASDLDAGGLNHDYPGTGDWWIRVTVTNDLGLAGEAAVHVVISQ